MLQWKDFFDFSDDQPISEAIATITRLENTYVKMIGAVEESNQRLAGDLSAVQDHAESLLKTVTALNLGMEKHRNALTESAGASEELMKEYAALKSVQADNERQIGSLQGQLEKLSQAKEKVTKASQHEAGSMDDLKAKLAEAEKAYKAMGETADKSLKEEQLRKVEDLSAAYKEANGALTDAKKAAQVAAGSYNELNTRVNEAKKQLKSMEGGLDGTSAEFKELQKFVSEGSQRLKDWDEAIGDNFRNVGNYEGVLKNLKNEFKLAQDEMIAMAQAFGTESEEFIDAAAKAGALKDEIGDLTDAAKTLAGSPLENMSAALGDVFGKLKKGDFSGAVDSARQFGKASKAITFKEAITSTKQFGQTIGIVGKAILTNPLFLLAAVIIGVAITIYKLRDSLIPVKIAMDVLGKSIGFVVDLLKDFSDWLGISQFGLEEQTKAVVENAKAQIEAQTTKYERMIALAEAEGKTVLDLEKAKLRAIQTNALKAITILKVKQKTVLGLNEEEAQDLKDLTKAYEEAGLQLQIINAKTVQNYKKTAEEKLKAEREALFEVRRLRIQSALAAQEQIANDEQKDFEVRLNAIMKAEQLRNKLILMEREKAVRDANGIVYKEVQAREEANRQIIASARKREAEEIALLLATEKKVKEAAKRIADANQALENVRLNQVIQTNQQILEDENATLAERLAALNQISEAQLEIIQDTADKELAAARETAAARVKLSKDTYDKIFADESLSVQDRLAMLEEARNEQLQADEAYKTEVLKINEDLNNKVDALTKQTAKNAEENVFKILARDAQRLQSMINTAINDQLTALNEALAQGNISVTQYQAQRQAIIGQGMKEQLIAQLSYLEEELKLVEGNAQKRIEIEEQIAEVRRELSDQTAEEIIENEMRLQEALGEIKNQAVALAVEQFHAGIERNIAGLEAQIVAEEEAKNKSIAIAGDDAQAKAIIEQNFADKKKELERQVAAEKRKGAIFQKAIDATGVVVSTAKGIASAVAASPLTFGLPWSAFVAVTGALQLARILAAPIPAFFKGTQHSPEGPAQIAERGREIVVGPDGEAKIYTKPSIVELEGGSKVLPNYKTEEIIRQANKNGVAWQQLVAEGYRDATERMGTNAVVVDTRGIIASVEDMKREVVDSIVRMPRDYYDERGYRSYERTIAGRVRRLDNRTKLQ